MAKFNVTTANVMTILKTWAGLLRNLTINDNVKGYEWEGEADPGVVLKITHNLKVIPTRWIVTDTRGGLSVLTRAPESITGVALPPATATNFYLFVSGVDPFVGRVLILP